MAGTTKGLYFISAFDCFAQSVGRDKVKALCDQLSIPARFAKREEISMATLNVLIEEGIKLFWPNSTLEQGMFRQGEAAFPKFADTLIGKTALSLFSSHIKRLAARAPVYYSTENKYGTVEFVDTNEKSFRLEFRKYESYPHYHFGLISYVAQRIEPKAKIDLSVHNFVNHGKGDILTDFDVIANLP